MPIELTVEEARAIAIHATNKEGGVFDNFPEAMKVSALHGIRSMFLAAQEIGYKIEKPKS